MQISDSDRKDLKAPLGTVTYNIRGKLNKPIGCLHQILKSSKDDCSCEAAKALGATGDIKWRHEISNATRFSIVARRPP